MNMRLQRLLGLHRLLDTETGGESGGGGGGTSGEPITAPTATEPTTAPKAGEGSEGEGEGGKGKPTDAEAKLLKELMQHKSAAQKAKEEAEALRKQFDGIDPVKVREILAQQAEEERKKAEARGEYDRLVAQMAQSHKDELAAAEQRVQAAAQVTSTLQQQIADLTIGNAFTASSLVKEELTLTPSKARVIYGAHFEFKDGQVVAYDKPAGASDRTPLVDGSGSPLSFDAALKKLVESDPDKDQLLRSKIKPGSSSGAAPTVKPPNPGAQDVEVTGAARIARGLKALNLGKK